MPGISAGYRFRALDEAAPPWLAYYEMKSGALDSPEYWALAALASAREKSIMSSLATLDRRVYELISDSGAASEEPPPVVLAVSMSVQPGMDADLAAWYADEHIPMLLAVPGWRRVRRFRLIAGTAPAYLALHELTTMAALEDPGFRAAVTTPWRNRIAESVTAREQRVFGFHRTFG